MNRKQSAARRTEDTAVARALIMHRSFELAVFSFLIYMLL